MAEAFLESWVYAYVIPLHLLTVNGPYFVAKLFDAIYAMLGMN